MNMITQYDILRSSRVEELIDLVNAKVKDGWTVLEGAQIQMQPASGGGGFCSYVQTMVK